MTRPLPYARMYMARILLVVALIALIAAALLPSGDVSGLSLLFGRFHPLLVHLPIGILVLAVGLFAWMRLGFGERAAAAVPTLMHLGAWSAIAAAWAGLDLEAGGGYGGDDVLYHKIAGMAVATLAVVVVFFDYGRLRQGVQAVFTAPVTRLHGWTVGVLLVAVVFAGHLGGNLTHGPDFVTEHLPDPIRSMLGGGAKSSFASLEDPGQLPVYETLIRPALEARCTSCHGESQAKGKLRLDTPEHILAGGTSGDALVAGQPDASEMLRRIRLPASHEDAMPPDGRPGLSVANAILLEWWIVSGASFDQKLSEAEQTQLVSFVLDGLGIGEIKTGIFALDVTPPDSMAVVRLGDTGLSVLRLGESESYLSIRCIRADACLTDDQVAAMEPLMDQIAWVDLGGAQIDDARLAIVARLPHLERLHVQQTGITDEGIKRLAGREYLEYLNLYGTQVTDSSLAVLQDLPALEAVYLWQTAVSPEGAARLRESRSGLVVDTGAESSPPTSTASSR